MPNINNVAFLVNQQLRFAMASLELLKQDSLSVVQKNASKQACTWQLCSTLSFFFIERNITQDVILLNESVLKLNDENLSADVCIIKLKQQLQDNQSYLNALVSLQLSLNEKHTSSLFEQADSHIIALSGVPKYHWMEQRTAFYEEIYDWLSEFIAVHRDQTQQW